eukprot:4037947-Amphidinium_carterae.1
MSEAGGCNIQNTTAPFICMPCLSRAFPRVTCNASSAFNAISVAWQLVRAPCVRLDRERTTKKEPSGL